MEYNFPKNKKLLLNKNAEVVSTASYFPENKVSNEEIINKYKLNVTDRIITKTIGVKYRRQVTKGVTDSDLLLNAAQICLEKANIKVDQLSKILVTKFLGDRILPMTASIIQKKLGSNVAFHAIDIDGGANAFLDALNLSIKYISTTEDDEQYILILSGGINSVITSKNDLRTAFLFGDGAGAVLIKSSLENHFLASYEFSNWQYYDWAGSRDLKFENEISAALFEDKNYHLLYDLYMMNNWNIIKDFYIKSLEHTKNMLLEQSHLKFDQIDLFLFNEINVKLYDLLLNELKIPLYKSFKINENYGNIMSAMLPIKLDMALSRRDIKMGTKIMLLSFGEGVSGGGVIYQV